ncbi:MAG TPA: hypothetical protein VKG92_02455, partial [Flavobacteriales bacterium]|nr:hypothetical protein [Flavobacteriales bacterium]
DVYLLDQDSVLDYTIRFQNTGTDTAFTVVVSDTLPPELHASSFIAGAASHPYTYTLTGSGELTFRFENILLPDSNTNEPASHGFVTFRIKPDETLMPGTEIRNAADIFFDLNEPVRTADATVVMAISTGTPAARIDHLLAYPVPAREVVMLTLPPGLVARSMVVRAADGREVISRKLPATIGLLSVPLQGLAPGTYLLTLRDAEGRGAVTRFLKE